VSLVDRVLYLMPQRFRSLLIKRREVVKFILVGGTCYLLALVINYGLRLTVLAAKPVTALTIATVATAVISYILNREWSFRTRGGRRRHHEATLFFLVSAVAIGLTDVPLLLARYVFHLQVPTVSRPVQEISDFACGMILGTLLGMIFRLWAFRRWVFPEENARPGREDRAYSAPTPADADPRTHGHPINSRPVTTDSAGSAAVSPVPGSTNRQS
jgi:putative flippase GtrA